MKILEHGKLNNNVCRCPNCGCLFEYDRYDVIVNGLNTSIYLNGSYVFCPECGTQIYVSTNIYPPPINPIITCSSGDYDVK